MGRGRTSVGRVRVRGGVGEVQIVVVGCLLNVERYGVEEAGW